ncbi:MAG: AAA family ATPase [Gemmataceae bacterium]|nr:AAA family ATPase [Gemmataceae bacterium]
MSDAYHDGGPPQTGLILGKFLPPHCGHQYLFDFARAYVPHLTVLVCSLQREPIAGELRHRWVREMCPDAAVLHVTDENPSEPHEHPDFWDVWIATVRQCLPGGPDVVFTSEAYGDELARRLGAQHVVVDRARELVPVSGTQIRDQPLAYWRYLPPCVRPHFVKRVCLFGPESTGKTTLCRRLAEHYDTVWVSEYARGYLDHKASPCEMTDVAYIARGQAAAEDALARQANRVLFCDTDVLTTMLYSDLYYGSCPDRVRQAAEQRHYDLYLLNDVDVPWVADPQRDMPHRREELRDRWLQALAARGRPHTLVRGSWEERFTIACEAVGRLLGTDRV